MKTGLGKIADADPLQGQEVLHGCPPTCGSASWEPFGKAIWVLTLRKPLLVGSYGRYFWCPVSRPWPSLDVSLSSGKPWHVDSDSSCLMFVSGHGLYIFLPWGFLEDSGACCPLVGQFRIMSCEHLRGGGIKFDCSQNRHTGFSSSCLTLCTPSLLLPEITSQIHCLHPMPSSGSATRSPKTKRPSSHLHHQFLPTEFLSHNVGWDCFHLQLQPSFQAPGHRLIQSRHGLFIQNESQCSCRNSGR